MHVNSDERSIISKLCYWGPARAGKGDLLTALYNHFRAFDGEHTQFEERAFPPRQELNDAMSETERDAFIAGAEESMDASYDDLAESGTLVWFRTRLAKATSEDQYHVFIDTFTVAGHAPKGNLRDFTLRGADSVVFVADARESRFDATLESWENLQERDWDGPVILFVNGADEPDDTADLLGHDGLAFAEYEGFEETLSSFHAAARQALRHARSAN